MNPTSETQRKYLFANLAVIRSHLKPKFQENSLEKATNFFLVVDLLFDYNDMVYPSEFFVKQESQKLQKLLGTYRLEKSLFEDILQQPASENRTVSLKSKGAVLYNVISEILNEYGKLFPCLEPPSNELTFFCDVTVNPNWEKKILTLPFSFSKTTQELVNVMRKKEFNESTFNLMFEEQFEDIRSWAQSVKQPKENCPDLERELLKLKKRWSGFSFSEKTQKLFFLGNYVLSPIYNRELTSNLISPYFFSNSFLTQNGSEKDTDVLEEVLPQEGFLEKVATLFDGTTLEAFCSMPGDKLGAEFQKTFLSFLDKKKSELKWDPLETDVLQNGALFSIYFSPLLVDQNNTLSGDLVKRSLLRSPWVLKGYELGLYELVTLIIHEFKTQLHLPFLGQAPSKREIYEIFNRKEDDLQTVLEPKFLHASFDGVVGLFWLNFRQVPLVFNSDNQKYTLANTSNSLVRREAEYLDSVLYKLNKSFVSTKETLVIKKIIFFEFKGFALYPSQFQLDSLLDRLTLVFPLPGQSATTTFAGLPNFNALHLFLTLMTFLFSDIVRPRVPIWVKLPTQSSTEDLESCVPVIARRGLGGSRLFSLTPNTPIIPFRKERELYNLIALKLLLEEWKNTVTASLPLGFSELLDNIGELIKSRLGDKRKGTKKKKKKKTNTKTGASSKNSTSGRTGSSSPNVIVPPEPREAQNQNQEDEI